MEKIVSPTHTLIRKSLNEIGKEEAIKLWIASFKEDNYEFAKSYFDEYEQFTESFFYVDQSTNKLVLMGFFAKEDIAVENQTFNSGLIEGICVSESYKGLGIMTSFMIEFIPYLQERYDFILIQAYNWKIYEKFKFNAVSTYNLYEIISSENSKDINKIKKVDKIYLSTDSKRSSPHWKIYEKMMLTSGAVSFMLEDKQGFTINEEREIIGYESASLIKLILELRHIKNSLSIRIPSEVVINNESLKIIKEDVIETKALPGKKAVPKKLLYGMFF